MSLPFWSGFIHFRWLCRAEKTHTLPFSCLRHCRDVWVVSFLKKSQAFWIVLIPKFDFLGFQFSFFFIISKLLELLVFLLVIWISFITFSSLRFSVPYRNCFGLFCFVSGFFYFFWTSSSNEINLLFCLCKTLWSIALNGSGRSFVTLKFWSSSDIKVVYSFWSNHLSCISAIFSSFFVSYFSNPALFLSPFYLPPWSSLGL